LLAPLHIERLLGLADNEKPNVNEVVIVIVLLADRELGLIVTELGLNDADAPEGRPEADRLTVIEEL